AVVVEVAGADAGRPARAAGQAGAIGDVGERAVVVVPVQPRPRRLARRIRLIFARPFFQARAIQNQRVDPAVVVVVEKGDAGAIGLDDEPLLVDAAVDRRLAQSGAVG